MSGKLFQVNLRGVGGLLFQLSGIKSDEFRIDTIERNNVQQKNLSVGLKRKGACVIDALVGKLREIHRHEDFADGQGLFFPLGEQLGIQPYCWKCWLISF